jgi:predicted transcriptional regulator of viral defense system
VEAATIKERGLIELYKRLEHDKTYTYKTIKSILMAAGASIHYANTIIEELEYYGILERVERGVYKVNKSKLAKLAKAYGVLWLIKN